MLQDQYINSVTTVPLSAFLPEDSTYPYEHELDFHLLSVDQLMKVAQPYVCFETPDLLKRLSREESRFDYLYSFTITFVDPQTISFFNAKGNPKLLQDLKQQKRDIRDHDFMHRITHRLLRKIRKAFYGGSGGLVASLDDVKRMGLYALERHESGALHIHLNLTRPPAFTPYRPDLISTVEKLVQALPYTGESSVEYRATLEKEKRYGSLTYTLKKQNDRWTHFYTADWQVVPSSKKQKLD